MTSGAAGHDALARRGAEIEPPPRVLLVSSTLDDDGGIPVCAGQLAGALAAAGIDVAVAGQHARTLAEAVVAAAEQGVELRAIHEPWSLAGQWRAARRMRGIVREQARAARREGRRLVVHLHGVWVAPVAAAAAAAREEGAWIVVSPHGMLRREAVRKSRWRKALVWQASLRRQLAGADTLHVTSPEEGSDLIALLPGCRPVLVPLGVTPPAAVPRSRTAGEPRRAGYLGRLLPIKNLDGLLQAWQRAAPRGWRLSIDGPGTAEAREALVAEARRLGIEEMVDFGGSVALGDLGAHFSRLDLFVLPSRSEAFALVVGEALAAGVPAIVTTAAPWAEVETRGCGWSVSPDPGALAGALAVATALDADDLAARGQAGSRWVRREYSWERIAARHLAELYGAGGTAGAAALLASPSSMGHASVDFPVVRNVP